MGFKDCINADLKVFLNVDEYGELHDIDGQQIICALSDDSDQQQKSQDGVYSNTAMLFVSNSDLPDRPVPGQRMRIDGDLRIVQKCVENMRMLEITLEANEA